MKFSVYIFSFILALTSINLEAASELDCAGINHPAHQDEYKQCLRAQIAIKLKENNVDCESCIYQQETPETNGWVQALSVAVQPAAYLLATYASARFQNKSQEAAAKAYASGFTECTNRFNSYLNYNTSIGGNNINASTAAQLSGTCNNYGYGQYAGYGGYTDNMYGGYSNPYQQNGFSAGFMSGWGGPFTTGTTSSLYNNGMLSGSIGVAGTLTSTTSGVTTGFSF
jgi:hypothetical protein